MPDSNENELKEAVKAGIEEWLDKQFEKFGRWSFMAFISVLLAGVTYFILNVMGYHK